MNRVWKKAVVFVALVLCLVPVQDVRAKEKAELTKIDATAKYSEDWVLIDTDMSNDAIRELLDIDEVTLASIRSQWDSSKAKIEYDIVIPDQGADILINAVDVSESNIKEGSDLSDDARESLMQSVQTGLKQQGATVSHFEETEVAGQFGWKLQMSLGGTEVYEYQLLHKGKYVTFSINEIKGTLSQDKKDLLDVFMKDLTIQSEGAAEKAASGNKSVGRPDTQSSGESLSDYLMRVLLWSLGGALIGVVVAVIFSLIAKKRKKKQ